jgi:ABC1 atypical kinase-like domain
MSDNRTIPEGRLARFARMAGAGLRAGTSLLGDKAEERGATEAARMLGELRGLGAKAGQMMSYVDGFMPEGKRDAFEAAMKSLRAAAPTSSSEAIRAIVEEDLGAPVTELFAAWDDTPIASASIGQVHRARLADGREVAVKVQHPGIDRAIESDLANIGMFDGLLGVMGGQRFDAAAIFATVRARFREELDYGLEAQRQVEFAALHQGDPTILVPRVFFERCSRRVLTTELMRGESFEEACAAPEARRRAHCEALFRFVFRTQLVGATFIGEMKKATWRLPAKEVFALPAELMFTFRLQFGFYSVLSRLDADVDYAAVEQGFWHEVERRAPMKPALREVCSRSPPRLPRRARDLGRDHRLLPTGAMAMAASFSGVATSATMAPCAETSGSSSISSRPPPRKRCTQRRFSTYGR